MAEPSSTTTGIAIAAGTITLTGSIVGLQYDALLFGLVGGLISLMHLPPDSPALRTWLRIALSLFAAAFLAALLSPIAPPVIYEIGEWTAKIPHEGLRLGAAGVIGLSAQLAIPLWFKWAGSRVTGGQS